MPAEAVIAGVGVLTVLLGGAAFMIKKDMDYKVKIDKKVNPNKGKLRQSFWLKKMRARRKFQRKEQAIREKYYTGVKIVIINENGLDATQFEMKRFHKENIRKTKTCNLFY